MLSQIHSFVLQSIDPTLCEVEVNLADADAAVKESLDRVITAIKNSGYDFPLVDVRLLVNLAPADVRKERPVCDLSIAVETGAGWPGAVLCRGPSPGEKDGICCYKMD